MDKDDIDLFKVLGVLSAIIATLVFTYARPWYMLPVLLCALLFLIFLYCHNKWLKDGFRKWKYKTYAVAVCALFLSVAILISLTYSSRSILPIDDKIAEQRWKEEMELQQIRNQQN